MPDMTPFLSHGSAVLTDPRGSYVRPAPTPSELERLYALAELHEEMRERGFDEASVISLHPFDFHANGPLYRELKIPRIPLDDAGWKNAPKVELNGREVPYTQHIFTRWEPIIMQQVVGTGPDFMGQVSRKVILPIVMAQDLVMQNNSPEMRGGMFCYRGNHPPLFNVATRAAEKALLEEAHARQIAYYTQKFEDAEAVFANTSSITAGRWKEYKYNRQATEYLLKLGIVTQRPRWLTKTQPIGAPVPQKCLSCAKESEPGALRCTNGNCTYVFHPFEAFRQYVIGLDTPGAILALRRMTSEELETLIHTKWFSEEELEAMGFTRGSETKEEKQNKRPRDSSGKFAPAASAGEQQPT